MANSLPSACGHSGDKIVRYSSHKSGLLHTICTPCLNSGRWYVTEVTEEEIDATTLFDFDNAAVVLEIKL